MFTIGDIYWTEFLAFIIGYTLASFGWMQWSNKAEKALRAEITRLEIELSRYNRKRNELGRFTK